jgi:hypothetical protein
LATVKDRVPSASALAAVMTCSLRRSSGPVLSLDGSGEWVVVDWLVVTV